MKNLNVSMKLIIGFIIVSFITLIVGLVGIYGMYSIEKSYTDVLELHALPLPTMGHALEKLQLTRVDMRNAMLYTGQSDKLQSVETSALTNMNNFESLMHEYRGTIRSEEAITLYEQTQNQYETVYKPTLLSIINEAKQGMSQEALYDILNPATPVITEMTENYSKLMDLKLGMLNSTSKDNYNLFITLIIVLIIIIIVSIAIAMFLGTYIARLISKPINVLSGFMKRAAASGDISITAEEEKKLNLHMKIKDEIGQLTTDCSAFIDRITEVANELEYIANGDLTVKIKVLSSSDTMGNAMKKTVDNLISMFVDINSSSEQVSTGSSQISNGAQQLASGSTQQAATLEELSASIADVAEKTRENAERTNNASVLADNIMQSASKGSIQMEQMINAVNDINQANQNISKVIKAIDDIAFQTNILALNAAVEAARAGAAGKGFAVVAEEVRNLAAKSAESAKDTSELIANSMEKADLGTKIASETAESLAKIVSGISESNRIIAEIAQASEEQTSAIEQINIGVGGVTQVVQQNSATAEQSAAASEEMNGQADLLEDLISKFKIK